MPLGGFGVGGIAKPAFALALGLMLAACAYYPQPREEVRVSVGGGPERAERAAPYTSLYIPYAMISSLAYTRPENLDADHCPDPARLARASDPQAMEWVRRLQAGRWRCAFGLSARLPCPSRYPDCRPQALPDLQVWRRGACEEVVIAYRGVNLRDPADWRYLARARFAPPNGGRLEAEIDGLLAHSGCRNTAKMIAVGHSLGGGHAEVAGLANRRIRYVYAFNAHPVRGTGEAAASAHGLGIDSVHEAGELFFWQRRLRGGVAHSSCNPRFRSVQFNLMPVGLPGQQHNIDTLTLNMIEVSRGASGRSVAGEREAAQCAASPGG